MAFHTPCMASKAIAYTHCTRLHMPMYGMRTHGALFTSWLLLTLDLLLLTASKDLHCALEGIAVAHATDSDTDSGVSMAVDTSDRCPWVSVHWSGVRDPEVR